MKTTRNLLTLVMVTLLCLGLAATSFATIVGTLHDMTSRSVATQNGEVCIYCHSPHVEDISVLTDYNPLWSADIQTRTDFAPYTSSTLQASITDPLDGPSRLCMSCHDGSIAIDSALNGNTEFLSGDALVGGDGTTAGDLTSDHPIGFDYTAVALADTEINDEGSAYAGGSTIAAFLFGANNLMTCATCHDVHTDATDHFLVSVNTNSALCLACHIK